MSTLENTDHDQMLIAMINGISEIDTPLRVIDNSSTIVDLGEYASQIAPNYIDYTKDIKIIEQVIPTEVTNLGKYAASSTLGEQQYTDHL
jgi:hypothetical protein